MLGYWVCTVSGFSSTLHIRNRFTIRCPPPFRRLLTTLQCVTQHICVSYDSRSSYRLCSETALTGWSFGWTRTLFSVIFEVLYAMYLQFGWMLIFKVVNPVIKYKHYVNKSESKGGGKKLFDLFVWLVLGDRESRLKLCAYNFIKYDIQKMTSIFYFVNSDLFCRSLDLNSDCFAFVSVFVEWYI